MSCLLGPLQVGVEGLVSRCCLGWLNQGSSRTRLSRSDIHLASAGATFTICYPWVAQSCGIFTLRSNLQSGVSSGRLLLPARYIVMAAPPAFLLATIRGGGYMAAVNQLSMASNAELYEMYDWRHGKVNSNPDHVACSSSMSRRHELLAHVRTVPKVLSYACKPAITSDERSLSWLGR